MKTYYATSEKSNNCPSEDAEQITFFNKLRREYPDTWGALAFHPKNEGKKTPAQIAKDKAMGMVSGTSDIIIPGAPAFVCELKKQHGGRITPAETKYLDAAEAAGCFACLCMGWEAAYRAFKEWLNLQITN